MSNEIIFSDKYKPLFDLLEGKYPDVDTVVITGGRGCFYGNQKVSTNSGSKSISDIKIGDTVKCYNENNNNVEYKKVVNTFKYDNTKLLKITLKSGTVIKVTPDHKFFHNGCWIEIKDLLSLLYGNMEKNT